MQAVASGNRCVVHGAMRVLTGSEDVMMITGYLDYATVTIEFCQEVTDQQMPHVAPIIFPQLLQVITQPQVCVTHCVGGCTVLNFDWLVCYVPN